MGGAKSGTSPLPPIQCLRTWLPKYFARCSNAGRYPSKLLQPSTQREPRESAILRVPSGDVGTSTMTLGKANYRDKELACFHSPSVLCPSPVGSRDHATVEDFSGLSRCPKISRSPPSCCAYPRTGGPSPPLRRARPQAPRFGRCRWVGTPAERKVREARSCRWRSPEGGAELTR